MRYSEARERWGGWKGSEGRLTNIAAIKVRVTHEHRARRGSIIDTLPQKGLVALFTPQVSILSVPPYHRLYVAMQNQDRRSHALHEPYRLTPHEK